MFFIKCNLIERNSYRLMPDLQSSNVKSLVIIGDGKHFAPTMAPIMPPSASPLASPPTTPPTCNVRCGPIWKRCNYEGGRVIRNSGWSEVGGSPSWDFHETPRSYGNPKGCHMRFGRGISILAILDLMNVTESTRS